MNIDTFSAGESESCFSSHSEMRIDSLNGYLDIRVDSLNGDSEWESIPKRLFRNESRLLNGYLEMRVDSLNGYSEMRIDSQTAIQKLESTS